ncbi:MAG: hypothetical protein WED05_08795 [Candidatus Atabeyarchaeum deiterrae]
MVRKTKSTSQRLTSLFDPRVISCLRKLSSNRKVDSPEFRRTVGQLEEAGLSSNGAISEHGVIVLWKIDELNKWLKEASKTVHGERIEIDDYADENSWAKALIQFIDASKKTLKITTIGYSSLEDPVWGKQFEDVLVRASQRDVDVTVLAARGFMSKNIVEFFSEIGHIELVERALLEKPPLILPPILKDFSHVAITDTQSWLYLEPHEAPHKITPRVHVGKVYMNSPQIARMLEEIFDTVWTLSKQ